MMMLPMLTEETPTYICFSGFDCAEAGTGKVNMTAHISAADVMLRKGSLRARDIGHLQAYCLQVYVASIEVTAESFFLSHRFRRCENGRNYSFRDLGHIPEPIPEFACKSCALQLEY